MPSVGLEPMTVGWPPSLRRLHVGCRAVIDLSPHSDGLLRDLGRFCIPPDIYLDSKLLDTLLCAKYLFLKLSSFVSKGTPWHSRNGLGLAAVGGVSAAVLAKSKEARQGAAATSTYAKDSTAKAVERVTGGASEPVDNETAAGTPPESAKPSQEE